MTSHKTDKFGINKFLDSEIGSVDTKIMILCVVLQAKKTGAHAHPFCRQVILKIP